MRHLLPLLITILLVSCKKDTINTTPELPGYYEYKSISSDISVDMNNDGIRSQNIFKEITDPYHTLNGGMISFYNFRSPLSLMEIRPLSSSANNARLIEFNMPHQEISTIGTDTFFLSAYQRQFITYSYEPGDNNQITLVDNNAPFNQQFGSIQKLELVGQNELRLWMIKKVFCFVEKEWLNINLVISLKKIP